MALPGDVWKALAPFGKKLQYWALDVASSIDSAIPIVDDPTVDNFAAMTADGKIKDSGYDHTAFAINVHVHTASDVTDLSNTLTAGGIAILGSVSINAQTLTKQTFYTVPTGKSMIPFAVLFRNPSATLAGLVDMDIGGNATADDWLQQITLNAFTATTDYGLVVQPEQAAGPPIVPVKKTVYTAGTDFGGKINIGSTNPATVTAITLGFIY